MEWDKMQSDDIPGYLFDDVMSWLAKYEITDWSSYSETHQLDAFLEDKDKMMDNIVSAVLAYENNL